MIAVFVPCAGRATRLGALSEICPKALVPLGDRPLAAFVFERLRASGATRIVVNAHHHADRVAAFARAHGAGVSHEDSLLGTAGGLAHAAAHLGAGDVLVWNGDILADVDVGLLTADDGDAATLAMRFGAVGSGNVGVDSQRRIVRLRGETARPGETHGGEFIGVHVVRHRLRAALPDRGCLVGDVYLPALRRGEVLRAVDAPLPFWDLGTVDAYLAANQAWLRGRGARLYVAPDAHVAGEAMLEDVIVGAAARVDVRGVVRRARSYGPALNSIALWKTRW